MLLRLKKVQPRRRRIRCELTDTLEAIQRDRREPITESGLDCGLPALTYADA